MLGQKLFVFVTEPAADGNDNAVERQLRSESIIAEASRWVAEGQSCFADQIESHASSSTLRRLRTVTVHALLAAIVAISIRE